MNPFRRVWLWAIPNRFVYVDRLTLSARRLLIRIGVGLLGLVAGLAGGGLFRSADWPDILAGALLAWGVSIIVWAASSYRRGYDETLAELVDEAIDAGLDGSHPLTVHAKMLRLELLSVKADLERELGELILNCSDCGRDVHWVAGLGISPGHWAHREPAPHGEPSIT